MPYARIDDGIDLNPAIATHEFPDIGHADLLECPAEAVRVVSAFFREALVLG